MVAAGAFAPESRVELDRGRLIDMALDGARHISAGKRLAKLWYPVLVANPDLNARVELYTPGSVRLTPTGSARAPDALLCPPGFYEREGRWPEARECHLAVEFADSTLRYFEGTKRPDYAAAGLPELWIVRLDHEDVRVCRGPREDGSWTSEVLLRGADALAPEAAPALAITPTALFAD